MPITTHTITGNAGEPNALVSYSGTASGTVTADGSGNYTIGGLANGSYTIAPSLAGFNFSPVSSNQTLSGTNLTGVNFSGSIMTATLNAMLGQYAGSSWDAAFPQPPGESPNLDLIHIRGIGNQVLAVVNHAGVVSGGSTSALVLTSVSVASLVLTSVVGATGVYHGTITGGAANAFVGKTAVIAGFVTGGNNGSFVVTASDATTITVAPTTQADETHAGTAGIVGVTLVTYNGTITGGGASALAGSTAVITGFSTSTNNVTAPIASSTASTLVTKLVAQVNETHAGAAAIGLLYMVGGTRIGTFKTFLDNTATVAALFANAFANPALSDIIQCVSPNGESVVSYVDYLGVSH
jgi:hypothetical protein